MNLIDEIIIKRKERWVLDAAFKILWLILKEIFYIKCNALPRSISSIKTKKAKNTKSALLMCRFFKNDKKPPTQTMTSRTQTCLILEKRHLLSFTKKNISRINSNPSRVKNLDKIVKIIIPNWFAISNLRIFGNKTYK